MDKEITRKTEELVNLIKQKYNLKLESERKPVFSKEADRLYRELRRIGKSGNAKDKIRWAKKKSKFGYINLDIADLSDLNLSHVDFTGINLAGANFENSNLEWANFSGTKCMLANFRNANMHLVNMVGVIAVNADFRGANLSGVRMREGIYYYADFSNATIQGDFSFSGFYGAKFNNAIIENTNFTYSAYHEEPLKKARIKSIILFLNAKQAKKALENYKDT